LVSAMRTLFKFQFYHDDRLHQVKQYLIMNELYEKPISKKNLNKYTIDTKIV